MVGSCKSYAFPSTLMGLKCVSIPTSPSLKSLGYSGLRTQAQADVNAEVILTDNSPRGLFASSTLFMTRRPHTLLFNNSIKYSGDLAPLGSRPTRHSPRQNHATQCNSVRPFPSFNKFISLYNWCRSEGDLKMGVRWPCSIPLFRRARSLRAVQGRDSWKGRLFRYAAPFLGTNTHITFNALSFFPLL